MVDQGDGGCLKKTRVMTERVVRSMGICYGPISATAFYPLILVCVIGAYLFISRQLPESSNGYAGSALPAIWIQISKRWKT